MVGADHPDGPVGLQHPTCRQQPGAGESVVGLKAFELVPVVVDGIDLGLVRAVQIAVELQIVSGSAKMTSIDFSGSRSSAATQSPFRIVSAIRIAGERGKARREDARQTF